MVVLATKSHRLSIKYPNTRHKKPNFELLVRGVQETFPKLEALVALGCLPESDSKSLLLKTPHPSVIGLVENELDQVVSVLKPSS